MRLTARRPYPRTVPSPVLIRQHVESAPPGWLAEWLDARGLAYEVDRSWHVAALPDPEDYAFVVSLGHDHGAGDTHLPAVTAERELLARALAREVPVLGLCYGGSSSASTSRARRPARSAAWLDARGLAYEVDRSWLGGPLPDPGDYAFVASLGHDRGAGDTHVPAVAAEHELLAQAVARDVPVLGLCYGGQVLAAVLGAQVGPAPVPELGWREIETDDPSVVPAGPWLEWHFERFTTPPGATELARTAEASQAFRLGPHLGVQFHPEATVDIVAGWATRGRRAARGARDRRRRGAADRVARAPGGGAGRRLPALRRVPRARADQYEQRLAS